MYIYIYIYITSTNIPPFMIINRIYETQTSVAVACVLPDRAKNLSAPPVPARRMAEAWENSRAKRCRKSESDGRKVRTFTLSLKGFELVVSLYSPVTVVTGFRVDRR